MGEIKITADCEEVLKKSRVAAQKTGCDMLVPEHILLSMVEHSRDMSFLLAELGVDKEKMSFEIGMFIASSIKGKRKSGLNSASLIETDDYIRVVRKAASLAINGRRSFVTTIDLLQGFFSLTDSHAVSIMLRNRMSPSVVKEFNARKNGAPLYPSDLDERVDELTEMADKVFDTKSTHRREDGAEEKTVGCPYAVELVQMARKNKIDPLVGRGAEVERVVNALHRRFKNNVVLVGEPGCVLGDTKIKVRKVSENGGHQLVMVEKKGGGGLT